MTPEKLLFAKSHEWVAVDRAGGAATATVGVSAFALQALTDLVYIELPKVGRQVKAGEPFGEIESVKAVSDLYAPVSGEIVEVHGTLSDKLESFDPDPYGEGWLVKIKMTSEAELKTLMDYPAYQKQCAEEEH